MKRTDRLIAEYDMLPPGGTVLCAVSGGGDSMCLLHILMQRGAVVAAHYNHRLRGAASERDAAFVSEQCRRWGVPLVTGGGDVAETAAKHRRGVEETARAMRYAFLEQTAKERGIDRIATAHTADDNLETILLHLTRGSALRGLAGIPPRRGPFVRPLLEVSRAEIEAYLSRHHIPFVTDGSNADAGYARNRIRAQVVPVLRSINPAVTNRAVETARILRGEDRFLDELAASYRLQDAPEPLAPRRAAQLLRGAGQTTYTAAHLRAVARLFRAGGPSAMARLPGGVTAQREYDTLRLIATAPAPAPEAADLLCGGTVSFGAWRIAVTAGLCPAKNFESPVTFWLDCDKIKADLSVRGRTAGDSLCLPGRRRRALKKLMIDARVPRRERDSVPVLVCGGVVAGVGGFGPDEAFLAAPGDRALCVTMTKDGEG